MRCRMPIRVRVGAALPVQNVAAQTLGMRIEQALIPGRGLLHRPTEQGTSTVETSLLSPP